MKKFPVEKKLTLINIAISRWRKELKQRRKRKYKETYYKFNTKFIDFLFKKMPITKKAIISGKKAEIIIPEIFSFYYNPNEVLDVINSVVTLRDVKKINFIYFDHSKCKTLDLAASAIMDICVLELKKVWKSRNRKFKIGGKYPDDPKITEILRETGLIRHLDVKNQTLPKIDSERYIPFRLIKGGQGVINPKESTKSEIICGKISKYFDDCIRRQNYQLLDIGKAYIAGLVGEILDNVEQHSIIKEWYIIGYLRQEKYFGECNISIFNIGNSIYESYNIFKSEKILLDKLKQRSNKHKSLFSNSWTEESLWTLYSLQEGVSRFNYAPEEEIRGHGTIQMMEFFHKIGQKKIGDRKARMTILSGSTLIKFDGKYHLSEKIINGEKRKIIAFNRFNNLDQKPDPKRVRSIDRYFPGTIIDMKFYLDPKHLSKIK